MLFSSLSFLYVFLPLVLAVYYLVPARLKNVILLLFSLLFYAIGEQKLVLLLLLSSVVDYTSSLGIERFRKKAGMPRLFLGLSIAVNIALLGYFKYIDLVIRSINAILDTQLDLLKVALPIGISFFTFQTMSYTFDVYRGEVKAERNFLDFFTYVSLFPQLIAGPIVRYKTVAAELKERKFDLEAFASGIGRFCVGLGKKILIANTLAVACKIYAGMADKTVLMTWVYAISFSLQIYFDFSGYSDMAIGLGKLFGFSFPENFNYPFIARSVTEFWRRWHMTLGVWFRDYVYIPMGGNRVKAARFVFNILVVWFLTGLWHGAEYNFIVWGLYYGLLLLLEKFLLKKPLQLSRVLSHLYLLLITVLGFVLFDAPSISEALHTAGRLFGIGAALTNTVSTYYARSYALIIVSAAILATPLARQVYTALQKHQAGKQVCAFLEPVASLLLLILSTAYLVDGSYNPFMYFRF
ncbi:MAG: MBOAT family protein [Clostridiaceae bacterium]|jgi:alginate O-acetyltransferase complex protein AlgI|nr:MBOAT family protein [Clostridiaceae bacterium]